MTETPPRLRDAETFRRRMIEWYRENGDRGLPWRNTRDAWHILTAALLLRKTTVKQVLEVYEEFIKRFPNPKELAAAHIDEVKSVIRPLGIEHIRADLLKKLAEELVEKFGGSVPCDEKALKSLPGVGEYAASEVLLIACNTPRPLLDRNMIRVLERVFGAKSKKKRPHTDRELWELARSIVPDDPELAKEFNFAVLDFARKICTARAPKCGECPLANTCLHFHIHGKRGPAQ